MEQMQDINSFQFQFSSEFSSVTFNHSTPNTLDFSQITLADLEKISHKLQIDNFSLLKKIDLPFNSIASDSNKDWDFEKGVWKDHLSIHDQIVMPKPLHIFSYGSLCWNIAPELKHCKIKKAYVKGFQRRFWQVSTDHRGTVENPGLVVSLVSDEEYKKLTGFGGQKESICYGLAFEIPEGEENEILRALDYREKGGYKRKMVKMFDVEEKKEIEGVVYIGEINNPHFAKKGIRENIFECARIISVSQGESGRNSDYLRNLEGFLKKNGFIDEYIFLLSSLVNEFQTKSFSEQIMRINDFCLDFSLKFEDDGQKIVFWIWVLNDSRSKKEHLINFTFWMSSLYPNMDFSEKVNPQYLRKGIEIIFHRKEEREGVFNFHDLIRKFIFLTFENFETI